MFSKFRFYKILSNTKGLSFCNMNPKRLVAFDFDCTIVNKNSDIVARDLLDAYPNVKLAKFSAFPGWIEYMQMVFETMHDNKITRTNIENAIGTMGEVPGMRNLIKWLHSIDVDVIIISDANSILINTWCQVNGISDCIKRIYTNPASFSAGGKLNLKPFTRQTDCKLCSLNLCKGTVLNGYIREMSQQSELIYDQIFYIGDGKNDICPVLKLGEMDYGCARSGFCLAKQIDEVAQRPGYRLDATMLHWTDGNDMREQIQRLFVEKVKKDVKNIPGWENGTRKF